MMITVGTAGHIDHGKSAIVRRLTGTDPDRLPEEKARGMTIDLGFAFYTTPAGEDIALVDVPGHERFVKNMIAGAGGIDAVMLVVAADDGWMPQSEEHFQITRLLGVEHGWVVINKCDLMDNDWLDLLESDIREKVKGTFLESQPILRISAETGDGFDRLTDLLDNLSHDIPAHTESGKARLFVDRSFVRPGIGGVVTGTLRGGQLAIGQQVAVWPSLKRGRVRTLHSRGEEVATATPGQRTAVSLTGIEKDLLIRGGVISERLDLECFVENAVLVLRVELAPSAPLPVTDRRRALVIIGTTEAEGEVRMFDREEIGATESGIIFFRPDRPVYSLIGDHFIIRLPTPMVTLGGGRVLDHLPRFPRRKELERLSYLELRERNKPVGLLLSELRKHGVVNRDNLLRNTTITNDHRDRLLDKGRLDGSVASSQSYMYEIEFMKAESRKLHGKLRDYQQRHAHASGLSMQHAVALSDWPAETTAVIVDVLSSQGLLTRDRDQIVLKGHEMTLSGAIKQAHDEIISQLSSDAYAPPTLEKLASGGKNHQQAIRYIIESGEGYKCGSEFVFLQSVWQELVSFVRETLRDGGELRPANLRDRFGFSRKYAIPILEETDRIQLTRRDGDVRRRGDRFDRENTVS